MDAEQRNQWQRSSALFAGLVELEPAARRAALAAMDLDPAVRAKVEELLAADGRDSGPLDAQPPFEILSAALAPDPPADLAGRRLGAYRLCEELGRGGMAVVYRAERDDGTFEQEVAVKVLGTGLLPTAAAERFRREQQLLARLRHRSIAAMLDGGVAEDGTPFLVMERIDGRPIDRYCEEEGLGVRERLRLFLEVCEAVAFAHRNLVVHRDVKPNNVLVSSRGEVKLLDFGIAKLVEPELSGEATRTYARVLTPGFAAPEQLAGGAITTATDVFGLGRLLDRILGPGPRERDLDNIVRRAQRDEPERRYPDAQALAADLDNWLAMRPVSATPDSLYYRLGKAVRRHRAAVATAALVLTVAAAGLATTLAQAARARREAANAAAVHAFLVDLFRASDPDSAQGKDPTASELLARGAARAREQYRAEPLLQADLLHEIGSIQRSLGQSAAAQVALTDAIELRTERLGADDPTVALARAEMAQVRYDQGDANAAIDLLRAAFAALERGKHPAALRIELRLAEMLMIGGVYGESRERSERVLAAVARLDGAEAAELEAAARQTLGGALQGMGELEPAAAELARAIEIERRRSPRGSTNLAIFLSEAGLVALDRADYAAAEAAFAESLALKRRLLGDEHVQVVADFTNLGWSQVYQKRFAEGVRSHAEAVRLARRVFAGPHPQLAAALAAHGVALRRAGRPADAVAPLAEGVAVWRALPQGPSSHGFASDLAQYGALLAELGRHAEAEAALAEAIGELRLREGGQGPRVDVPRARRATSLAALGRHREAVEEFAATLPALAETRFGWGAKMFHTWQLDYTGALLAVGRRDAAAQALAALRTRLTAHPDEVWPEGAERMAQLEAHLADAR